MQRGGHTQDSRRGRSRRRRRRGECGSVTAGSGGSVAAGSAGELDASITDGGSGGRGAAIVDAGHEGHAISDGGSGSGLDCFGSNQTQIVNSQYGQSDAATVETVGCGSIKDPPSVFGKRSLVKLDCAPASDWDYVGNDSDNSTHYASGQVRLPGALAVSGNYLYYTNANGLMRLPTTGGAPVTLLAAPHAPSVIAADQSHVYGGVVDETNHQGTIVKIALAGGAPEVLTQFKGDPVAIAVDAENVYFTASPLQDSKGDFVPGSGGLTKVPLSGGTPTTLTMASGSVMAVSPTDVYVSSNGVWKVPITGGNSSGVGPAMWESSTGVAYHAGVVYWTGRYVAGALIDYSHGDVWALDPAKGTNVRVACWQICENSFCDVRKEWPDRITVENDNAYWVNTGSSAVSNSSFRSRRQGRSATPLRRGRPSRAVHRRPATPPARAIAPGLSY